MLDADEMARIYAQVVNGKPKAQSALVVDNPEASEFWDTVAAEVEQARQDQPGLIFEIPSEIPDADAVAQFAPDGKFGAAPAPESTEPPADGATPPPPETPTDADTAPEPEGDES